MILYNAAEHSCKQLYVQKIQGVDSNNFHTNSKIYTTHMKTMVTINKNIKQHIKHTQVET